MHWGVKAAAVGYTPSRLIYTAWRPCKGCKGGRLLRIWIFRDGAGCGFAKDNGYGSIVPAGVSYEAGVDKVEPAFNPVEAKDFPPKVLGAGRETSKSFLNTFGGAFAFAPSSTLLRRLLLTRGHRRHLPPL
ncbi:hypothetical protein Tco_0203763 [Tanacetum coccineum]